MSNALLHDPAERQRRIDQKRQLILSWLVDFTWTTPRIAGEVMGLHSRSATNKTLLQLEQQSLIRSATIQFLQGRDVTVYGITPQGLLWADSEDDSHFGKPNFDPGKVSISTFQHRLDVQLCRLHIRNTQGFAWVAENNLPKDITYRPDAIVKSETRAIALELERTAKTRKRYQQIIVQHLNQISRGYYEQVHYISTIDGFVVRLQKLFYSIQHLSFKGQKIHFSEDLKKHFEFSSLEEWKL